MAPPCSALTHGPLLRGALVSLVLLAAACDRSGVGRTYAVRGKITLDNQPLVAETTIVLFKPDASKGNASRFEPIGTVDEAGNYTLSTNGKNGAPPGWYRVTVAAREGHPEHPKGPQRRRPVARSLLPAKYGSAEATDLVVEVVSNPAPGAYDLKLAR